VTGNVEGEKANDILHISSSRGGSIPGTHTVTFDSMADTIELTHRARSRRGFAEGALISAAWVQNKKGIFTMENVLDDITSI
jgi:4-hydroxy-tetrahydrodipicolinate reductase